MSDTRDNVRPSYAWLAPAAALALLACYAEVPGSAPRDDSDPFDDGGLPGFGGTLAGGNPGSIGGGDLDTGVGEPIDAGSDSDGSASVGCDGVGVGTVQTRKLYAEAQVVPPATCKSETQMRTCRSSGWSAWSGTFQAEQCTQAAVRSCGALAHGATAERARYPLARVNDYNLCDPEEQTQSCNDGTLSAWTGSATAEKCEVDFLGKCSLLSDLACVSGTQCSFKLSGSLCLGSTSHVCGANTECASGTCVNGACAAAKVPAGGSCDETADCASCSGPSSASVAAVCNASKVCVCGTGAVCSANTHCEGTCAGQRCVAPNTSCDNNEDCDADRKCVKSGGPAVTGSCLLKDGQPCTANAQCENYCRPVETNENFTESVCAPRGGRDAHCDENADCNSNLVCRFVTTGPHCADPGQLLDACDETADCAQSTPSTCTTVSGMPGTVCFPMNTGGTSGAACLIGLQCVSGTCDLSMGTPGTCM